MNSLTYHDLQFALLRTPKQLLEIMKRREWSGKIFIGGGFLRSIVAGDPVNDVDVFCGSKDDAERLRETLAAETESRVWTTDNAFTILGTNPPIQIIHRWSFGSGPSVADSFDFTCCCAAFWFDRHGDGAPDDVDNGGTGKWRSYCDSRFYCDVAGKRLIYRNPVRNEDAGGSMLRVLKYYQKGYRIPLDSLADVITRLVQGVEFGSNGFDITVGPDGVPFVSPEATRTFSRIICGLLREVDPQIDPGHVAHLPAENTREPLAGPQ
jgi:hypothetical protein